MRTLEVIFEDFVALNEQQKIVRAELLDITDGLKRRLKYIVALYDCGCRSTSCQTCEVKQALKDFLPDV